MNFMNMNFILPAHTLIYEYFRKEMLVKDGLVTTALDTLPSLQGPALKSSANGEFS